MKIFKSKVSKKAFFNFKGSRYSCVDGIFRTADKDLISFLEGNANFECESKPVKETKKTSKKEA